jgi:hypothetical protein
MRQMWRLSEAGPRNLGLAFADDGLLIGQTPLIERRDGRFAVRPRGEIERLLKCAHGGALSIDRLMSGFARVAAALNANDHCMARIAAVHLQIPDLPDSARCDALATEDSLIKYARDEGGGVANWNPALHPRAGTAPNPGWFASTEGGAGAPTARVAENDGSSQRSDASPRSPDDWVHLPPGDRIDELGDFLEWLANAKPEDEQKIREEINRYWAGDVHALSTLHAMLSRVLEPGTTRDDRQRVLDLIDHYSRYDPSDAAHVYDELFDLFTLLGGWRFSGPSSKSPAVPSSKPPAVASSKPPAARSEIEFEEVRLPLTDEERANVWKFGWAKRGKIIDRLFRQGSLHDLSRTIDDLVGDVAISNKSVDLNAPTYQDFRRLFARVNKDVEKLEAYSGTDWGGDSIKDTDVASKVLRLIIPKGSMTPVQREAIETATRIARSKNIRVIVVEF